MQGFGNDSFSLGSPARQLRRRVARREAQDVLAAVHGQIDANRAAEALLDLRVELRQHVSIRRPLG